MGKRKCAAATKTGRKCRRDAVCGKKTCAAHACAAPFRRRRRQHCFYGGDGDCAAWNPRCDERGVLHLTAAEDKCRNKALPGSEYCQKHINIQYGDKMKLESMHRAGMPCETLLKNYEITLAKRGMKSCGAWYGISTDEFPRPVLKCYEPALPGLDTCAEHRGYNFSVLADLIRQARVQDKQVTEKAMRAGANVMAARRAMFAEFDAILQKTAFPPGARIPTRRELLDRMF